MNNEKIVVHTLKSYVIYIPIGMYVVPMFIYCMYPILYNISKQFSIKKTNAQTFYNIFIVCNIYSSVHECINNLMRLSYYLYQNSNNIESFKNITISNYVENLDYYFKLIIEVSTQYSKYDIKTVIIKSFSKIHNWVNRKDRAFNQIRVMNECGQRLISDTVIY